MVLGGRADWATWTLAMTSGWVSNFCAPADNWSVTTTDQNHSLFVTADAVLTDVDANPLKNGSLLGVFYTNSDGVSKCAGYVPLAGDVVQIAAMGDDSQTPEIDGLSPGAELEFKIWDVNACEEYDADVQITNGPDTYTSNAITFIGNISALPNGPSSQTLELPSGWSMFSTYLHGENMALDAMLATIVDDVIIAKNYLGQAYLPEFGFNGVGDVLIGQGYQIKTSAAVDLTMEGTYAFPELHPIELGAGWNMIGYLRTDGAPADAVFADVVSTGNLIIVKDYLGKAYLPEFGFNGIGNLEPGIGYQVKVNNADVLQLHGNDTDYRIGSVNIVDKNLSYFANTVPTGNNMTVVIEDAAWDVTPDVNAEVAAFDNAGNMIGSTAFTSPVTVLTVWGDDATTSVKEGSSIAEDVTLKVWNSKDLQEIKVTDWAEGSSKYQKDAINIASNINTYQVVSNVNSSDKVLVEVLNILGQKVDMEGDSFEGKLLFNIYDDGSVEKVVK